MKLKRIHSGAAGRSDVRGTSGRMRKQRGTETKKVQAIRLRFVC